MRNAQVQAVCAPASKARAPRAAAPVTRHAFPFPHQSRRLRQTFRDRVLVCRDRRDAHEFEQLFELGEEIPFFHL